ncbi:MAG TPA: DUF1616 domain-containing protein [Geobacterales bacterium]|nr:DUF1616 domain-containing protein [Geobacterales bacterium]
MSIVDKAEIKRIVLEHLKKKEIIKVSELASNLRIEEEELANALLEMENSGEIEIIEPFPKNLRFTNYLLSLDHAFWFHATNLAIILTIIIVLVIPESIITYLVKSAISVLFLIFFPGYTIVQFLFPGREISLAEKLAISIGISIGLIPVFSLLLYYTLNIGLFQIISMVSAFTFLMNCLAMRKKYKMAKQWAQILRL